MRAFLFVFALGCGSAEEAAPEPAPAPADEPAPAPEPAKEVKGWADMGTDEEKTAWLMERGADVYENGGSGVACKTCHQQNGEGLAGTFPPLKGQKEHMGDCATHGKLIIEGMSGELTVDGTVYNSVMPPQASLPDEELAAVISYVRNSWGNDYGICTPEEMKALR